MHDIIKNRCIIKRDNITLASGRVSNVYFDCRRATLQGDFLSLFADYVLDHILAKITPPPDAISGITLGSDFIVAALIMRAYQLRNSTFPVESSIVRKSSKGHGLQNTIENEPSQPRKILFFEDTITTGGSIATACDTLLEKGHTLVGIVCIVDRQEGGQENLKSKYQIPLISLFKADDFE